MKKWVSGEVVLVVCILRWSSREVRAGQTGTETLTLEGDTPVGL